MINPSDIVPVSEVQASLPRLIRRTRETGRPIVVTQRGRATAALVDIQEYQRLVEAAEREAVWGDIERMERELESGQSHTVAEARQQVRGFFEPNAKSTEYIGSIRHGRMLQPSPGELEDSLDPD